MTLKKLTTEEAQNRLAWLCGTAGYDLANRSYGDQFEPMDPIPTDAVGLLHEISRVAATVAKHYDERAGHK